MWIALAGGLGLFLLGMVVMTDGLKTLAGDAIRRTLIRFTRSPLSGITSGALSTAVLQSSSATTVAAVGFAAANLMSFPAALGIVLGANIGTTITGWMVALIGFKLKIGTLALPLVLAGTLIRMFAPARLAGAGFALAGFGLIFVGISTMQDAMFGLRASLSFDDLPADTHGGRLVLAAIGIMFTVIAQSSSAGVAAVLTAIHAGVIDFNQGAALVVGMDVGTTVTAAIAAIGGSVNARRTGLSHVVYNLMTGAGALLLISPYAVACSALLPGVLTSNAELALVGFHTLFNVAGVVIAFPFVRQFARLMVRLIPGNSPDYTGVLDPALLAHPVAALNAVQASLRLELLTLLDVLTGLLTPGPGDEPARLSELQTALDETHEFLDNVPAEAADDGHWPRLLATIHALDHMQRLQERCEESVRVEKLINAHHEDPHFRDLHETIIALREPVTAGRWLEAATLSARLAATLDSAEPTRRAQIVEQIGRGTLGVPEGTARLDASRWMQRVSRHLERITTHFSDAALASAPAA